MPHSDPAVEAARQLIRDEAAKGNKTAKAMLKGVVRDERAERRGKVIERP